MADDLTLEDVERDLSEKRLEATNLQAEVTDLDPVTKAVGHTDERPGVMVSYETVAGSSAADWLPVPDEYDHERSDLATLLDFTGADPNDLDSLKGQRVPFEEGRVRYDAMRQVLDSAAAANYDWDAEKRREKAQELLDGGL